MTEPHVHSITVFDSPNVVAVRDEMSGSLQLHLGNVTITVYGLDPYKLAPVLAVMTQEEYDAERRAKLLSRIRGGNETAPV